MHLRTSSQGVSPQIEILQSERTLLNTPVTQSALFKTFTEMPKAKAFSKTILRIPSPRARLMMQLTHNKVQREQIISQMTERHQEVISDALDQGTQKKLKIRVVQKLKRRDHSPKKRVNLKEGARVYQMPNLALPTVEAEIDHPPQLTFYGETQEFFRSARSFRPSFTESGSMALYGDSLYLYGGIAGDGIRDQMLRFDLSNFIIQVGFQDWHVINAQGEMPKNGRAALTVVALRNHFIYFGGSCKFNIKLKVRECFNTVFDYNASTRFWEKINVQGDYIEPRRHHKACIYGWKWMLVYGGVNSSEQVLNDTALYNIEKMIWKQWDVKSTPICCHSIINISQSSKFNDNTTDLIPVETIYCFGGKNQDGNSTNIMKKLIFYPNTTTAIAWETVQTEGKPPMPCHNHTMEFIKKIQGIVILGGQRDQIINGCLESSECFIFYPSINLWQQVLIEVLLSSKIAVFGGIGNGRYLEPLINYIETDQTQVQARVTKEQFTKRQNQYLLKSQKNSLEKMESLTYSPRQFTSFHSEGYKGQGFRFNTKRLSCIAQSTRSYLPQKRQVLVRYDILIGELGNLEQF
ncbi:unnamed protein product (macronuclear) [Paramecium tetraurelia]|uniref:Kelch motif family protein n=1 Tax=Paramecium tetraurelia TaxID=5888 RepID=A0C9G0_PARTE|nr:uncharacterized protein GSPATT00006733001 [Paramecium tetraurelia]CAK67427.1 unnamed protein product [Paramecium tetraurelia]|eukprot:XP_001434824.1 hypothetical protein (macronuclear) [Paramecium tetraurelia strain d4-2]